MPDTLLYALCTLAYLALAAWFWPGRPGLLPHRLAAARTAGVAADAASVSAQ